MPNYACSSAEAELPIVIFSVLRLAADMVFLVFDIQIDFAGKNVSIKGQVSGPGGTVRPPMLCS